MRRVKDQGPVQVKGKQAGRMEAGSRMEVGSVEIRRPHMG